jgi:hypothetical protein
VLLPPTPCKGKRKGFAMKDSVRLASFINFILLAGVPENRSAAFQDFIQPVLPQLLLTQFLRSMLARVCEHELVAVHPRREAELVFRIGQPE